MTIAAAVAQMICSFAFEAALAFALWSGIRLGRRALDAAILFCVFILVQSLHVMAAGLCGLLAGRWLGLSSLAGIAACMALPRTRGRIAECMRGFVFPCLRDAASATLRNPVTAACAAVAAAYVALHAAMFVVLAPPLTFDALTYHLSKVAQWVHAESLSLPDLPIKRVFWPSGMELLNCWWAVFLHRELLIEAPGLYFHTLATLATYALARNMELGRRPAAYASILFSLTPAVVGHGATCLTDLPTAAFFYVLLALWTSSFRESADAMRRWFATGIVLFLAVGVKPTIVFMLPGLLVAAAPFARRRDFAVLRKVFRAPALPWALLAAAVFVGSFWYLRNAVRFGNPFYPVEIGTHSEDGIQSGMFSFSNLCAALKILLAEKGILDGGWITPNLYRMTGWGWFAVACGIPCSFFLSIKSRRFALLFAGQLLAAGIVLGTVRSDSSCLRFLLWIPGPLAIGFAGAVSAVGGLPRPVASALVLAAAAASVLNLFTGMANAQRIDWLRQRSAIGKRSGTKGYWQMALANAVPEDEDVAILMHREGPLYLAYGPRFARGVATIGDAGAETDFADVLDRAGLRFLFCPDWKRAFPEAARSLRRQIEAGLMVNIRDCVFMRAPHGAEAGTEGRP